MVERGMWRSTRGSIFNRNQERSPTFPSWGRGFVIPSHRDEDKNGPSFASRVTPPESEREIETKKNASFVGKEQALRWNNQPRWNRRWHGTRRSMKRSFAEEWSRGSSEDNPSFLRTSIHGWCCLVASRSPGIITLSAVERSSTRNTCSVLRIAIHAFQTSVAVDRRLSSSRKQLPTREYVSLDRCVEANV